MDKSDHNDLVAFLGAICAALVVALVFAIITDDRADEPLGRPHVPIGTRVEIPPHKLKFDRGNPTGHAIVFMGALGTVYCFVQNGGV